MSTKQIWRRVLLAMLPLLALLANCSAEQTGDTTTEQVYTILVDQTEGGEFSAVLPDGTTFHDLATYQQEIPRLAQQAQAAGYQIRLVFGEHISRELDKAVGLPPTPPSSAQPTVADGVAAKQAPIWIPWTDYYLSVGAGPSGNISGCIHGPGYRVAIRLNQGDPGRQVFDLHLATYNRDGYRCFGAYESVHKTIDWCTCSPLTYDQVKYLIYEAAILAGIVTKIAETIRDIAAPLAWALL